jgi:hypothetical protein
MKGNTMTQSQRSIILGLILGAFFGTLLALTNCVSAAPEVLPSIASVGVFCAIFGASLAVLTSWKQYFWTMVSEPVVC